MAQPKPAPDALLFAAVFSRHVAALDWAREQIESKWGSVCLASPAFDHSETSYYENEMGSGLRKQFLVVEGKYDPANLATTKLESIAWETELASGNSNAEFRFSETRPLNIDPGYLTLSKLVLASAKDRAHRIYLRDGIFAEECLYYVGGEWLARPWTYPDYQRQDFQAFFSDIRDLLKHTIASSPFNRD